MSIIEVKNLGKKYNIGERQGYLALRDVLANIYRAPFRWFGNKFKTAIGQNEVNEFWALKDVNFKVEKGEVLGIIGRNGAGKSTLLKILSRITPPTTGEIRLGGRVVSLLEVGTGFHPELTGRENIYLNGAILGMRKQEIEQKFDEIVAFSGIEKFLDTPVKRYSSGMYVRLAFAVAAHLEPEILVIDEVLAVGDADFQKKCLGKMSDVTKNEGRTVLFVSHNMGAIKQLCSRTILLDGGQIVYDGDTETAIKLYVKNNTKNGKVDMRAFAGTLNDVFDFEEIKINGLSNQEINLSPSDNLILSARGVCKEDLPNFRITFSIFKDDVRVFSLHDTQYPELLPKGKFDSQVTVPAYLLRPGDYTLAIGGYGLAGKWIWGTYLVNFSIMEDWSIQNEFHNFGLVNLPHTGKRII